MIKELTREAMGPQLNVVRFRALLEGLAGACWGCGLFDECNRKLELFIEGATQEHGSECVGYVRGERVGEEGCAL